MADLPQKIHGARGHFDAALKAGEQAFSAAHPFRDFVRQAGLEIFQDTLQTVFAADYAPIPNSAGSVTEKLERCEEIFASHKAAYEGVFHDSANREICMKASVKSLQAAFKDILKA